MQRVITDPFELCLSLVAAIVEQVADAAAASTGENRFEIEARLLRQLMQDLPRQIEAAEGAARTRIEDGPLSTSPRAIAICRLLNRTRARARAFAPFYGRPSVGARSPG